MNTIKATLVISLLAIFAIASQTPQSPEPPLDDTRLTIHTLVREDIFAGFLQNDMTRFVRGEKNVEQLMEKRPQSKAELLAWKGGAMLYRAVRALEEKRPDEFKQKYQQVLDTFDQAHKLQPGNGGVSAVEGGSFMIFADQLPKELRAAAWERAYSAFQVLWKQQGAMVEKLPVHLKGELLGGLAQSALRTGRKEEAAQHLDKILAVLPGSPYEPIAKRWKADPKSAENSTIACMTCHDGGRLSARLTALNGK